MSNKKEGSKRKKSSASQRKNKQDCEHKRREKLSQGFHDLEKLLPEYDAAKRWGKIEVIQRAVKYIRYLERKNQQLLMGPKKDGRAEEIHRLQTQVGKLKDRNEHLAGFLRELGITRDLSKISSTFGQKPNKFTLTNNPPPEASQEGNEENVPLILTHFREDSEKRPKKKKKAKDEGIVGRSSSSATSKAISEPSSSMAAPHVSFTVKPLTLPIQGQSDGPSKIEVITVRSLSDIDQTFQDSNNAQCGPPNTSTDGLKVVPSTMVSPGGTPARIENIVTPGAARIDGVVTPGAARIDGIVTPGAARIDGIVTPGAARIDSLVTPGTARIDSIVTPGAARIEGLVTPGTARMDGLVTEQALNQAINVSVASSPELSGASAPTPLPQPHELTQLIQSKMEEVTAPQQNQAINIGRIESVFQPRPAESFEPATVLQPKNDGQLKNGLLCKQATVNGIPGYIIFPPKQSQVLQSRGSILDSSGMSFSQGNNTIQVVSQFPLQGGQINTPRGSILTQTLGNVPIMATGVTGAPNPGVALQVVNVPSQVVGMTQTYPGAVVPMGPCSFQLVTNNSASGNVPIVPKPENLSPVSVPNKIPISNLHPHTVPYTSKAADKRAKNKQAMINKRMKILGMKKEGEVKVEPNLSPSESVTSGNDILAFATKSIFTSSDVCDIEEPPIISNEAVPVVIEEAAPESTASPPVSNAEAVAVTSESESKAPASQKRKTDNDSSHQRPSKKSKAEEICSTKQGNASKVVTDGVTATTTSTETTVSSVIDSPVVSASVTEPPSTLIESPVVTTSSISVSAPVPVPVSAPVVNMSNVVNPIVCEATSIASVSKPVVSVSKPIVSVSKPIVSLSKPIVSVPIVSVSKPIVCVSKPVASLSKSVASVSKSVSSVSKPIVSIPKPISSLARSRPLGLKCEPRILCGGTDSKPMLDLLPDQDDSALIAEMTKNPKSIPQIISMKDVLGNSMRLCGLSSYSSKSPFYSSLPPEKPVVPNITPEISSSQTSMENDASKNQPVDSSLYVKPSSSTDLSSGLLSTLEKCVEETASPTVNKTSTKDKLLDDGSNISFPKDLTLKPPVVPEVEPSPAYTHTSAPIKIADSLSLITESDAKKSKAKPCNSPEVAPFDFTKEVGNKECKEISKKETKTPPVETSFNNDIFPAKLLDSVTSSASPMVTNPSVDSKVPLNNKDKGASSSSTTLNMDFSLDKTRTAEKPSTSVARDVPTSNTGTIAVSTVVSSSGESTGRVLTPVSSRALPVSTAPCITTPAPMQQIDLLSCAPVSIPQPFTGPHSTASLIMNQPSCKTTSNNYLSHQQSFVKSDTMFPQVPSTSFQMASLYPSPCLYTMPQTTRSSDLPTQPLNACSPTEVKVLASDPLAKKNRNVDEKIEVQPATKEIFPTKSFAMPTLNAENKMSKSPHFSAGKSIPAAVETATTTSISCDLLAATTSCGSIYSSNSNPVTTNVTFVYNNSVVSSNNCKDRQVTSPLTASVKGESTNTSSSASKLSRSKKTSYPPSSQPSCAAKSSLDRDSLGSFSNKMGAGRTETKHSPSNDMFQGKSTNEMSPFPTFFSSPDQSPSIGDKKLVASNQPLVNSGAAVDGFNSKDKVKENKSGGLPNSDIAPVLTTSSSNSFSKPTYVSPSTKPEAMPFPTPIGSEMGRYPLCTKNDNMTPSSLSYTSCPRTTASAIPPALSLPNFTAASSTPLLVPGAASSYAGTPNNIPPLLSPLPVMGATPSSGSLAVNPSQNSMAKPINSNSLGQITLPPSTSNNSCLGSVPTKNNAVGTDKYALGRSNAATTTTCSPSLPSSVHLRNQTAPIANYSTASSVSPTVPPKPIIGGIMGSNPTLGVPTSSAKGLLGPCVVSSALSLGSSVPVLSTIASGACLGSVPVTASSQASLCPALTTASSNLSLGSLPATACNSTLAGNLQMTQSHSSKHSTTTNKSSLSRSGNSFVNSATSTANLATTRPSEISFSWGNLTSTSNNTKKGACEPGSQFAGQYYSSQPSVTQPTSTAKFSLSQSNSTFPIVSDSKLLHPVNTSQSSKDFPFNSFHWYDVSNQLQNSPISMNKGGFEKTPPPPVSTTPAALAGLSLPSFSPSLPNQFTVPALSSFPSSLVSSALTTSSTKNPSSYALTTPQTNTATSSQFFQDLSSSASGLPTNLLDNLDFLNTPSTYLSQQYIPPKSVSNKPDAFRGSHDLASITQQNPDSSSSRCPPRIEDALINRLNNTNEIVGNQPFTVNHLMEKSQVQQIPTTASHLNASGRSNQQTPKSRCQKTPSVKSQKKSQSESKASKSSKQGDQSKKNCQLNSKRNDSRASWDGMSLGNKTANKYSAESLLAEKQVHPRGQDASNLAAFGHQYPHYSQQAALPLQPFDTQHQFGNSLHAHNRHGYGVGPMQGQGGLPAAYQSWNYIQPVNQITDANRFGSPGSFAGANVPHFQDPHNHAHLAQTMDQLSSSSNYSSHSLHRGAIGSIKGSAPTSHGFGNATTFHQNVQQSKPGTSPGGSKSSSKSKKKTAQDEDIDLGNSIFDPPSSMYFPLPSMNPSEDSQAFISNNFINSRSQLDFHNNAAVPKTQNFLHGHNQGQSLFPWPSNFPMTQERNCLLPSPRVPRHNPSLDAHGITDQHAGMQMGSAVTNFNVTTICPELNNRSPGSSGGGANRTSARDASMIPAEYPPPPDPNCIPMIHGGMNLTNILSHNPPSQVGIGFNPPVTLHGHTLSNMVTNLALPTTQH